MKMEEFLESVRNSVLQEEGLKQLSEVAYSRCDVSGYCMTGIPGNPNADNGVIPRAIASRWEIENRYQEQIAFCVMKQQQAVEAFADMRASGEFNFKALDYAELYYCHAMTFDEVAKLFNLKRGGVGTTVSRLMNNPNIDAYVPLDAA